jgi:hypothetical protein
MRTDISFAVFEKIRSCITQRDKTANAKAHE